MRKKKERNSEEMGMKKEKRKDTEEDVQTENKKKVDWFQQNLGSFYALRFENNIPCMFIFTFFR